MVTSYIAHDTDKDIMTGSFENEKKKNHHLKTEMRGHHFSYGNHQPIYSSMSQI